MDKKYGAPLADAKSQRKKEPHQLPITPVRESSWVEAAEGISPRPAAVEIQLLSVHGVGTQKASAMFPVCLFAF